MRRVLPAGRAELHAAMRYAVLNGGKRLRPLLCLAAAGVNDRESYAMPAAVAVELMHCYSLIHDDLPALDNDSLRRGKPATHVKFGSATAIIAGDAIQALSFEHLAQTGSADAVSQLASAVGGKGMCLGQAQDIARTAPSETTLRVMHERKTGSLISAAVAIGAQAAGIKGIQLQKLAAFAKAFGLMYQIADDISDATKGPQLTGKSAGKDQKQGKLTYVTVLGLQAARERLARCQKAAASKLAAVRGNTASLYAICNSMSLQAR